MNRRKIIVESHVLVQGFLSALKKRLDHPVDLGVAVLIVAREEKRSIRIMSGRVNLKVQDRSVLKSSIVLQRVTTNLLNDTGARMRMDPRRVGSELDDLRDDGLVR